MSPINCKEEEDYGQIYRKIEEEWVIEYKVKLKEETKNRKKAEKLVIQTIKNFEKSKNKEFFIRPIKNSVVSYFFKEILKENNFIITDHYYYKYSIEKHRWKIEKINIC